MCVYVCVCDHANTDVGGSLFAPYNRIKYAGGLLVYYLLKFFRGKIYNQGITINAFNFALARRLQANYIFPVHTNAIPGLSGADLAHGVCIKDAKEMMEEKKEKANEIVWFEIFGIVPAAYTFHYLFNRWERMMKKTINKNKPDAPFNPGSLKPCKIMAFWNLDKITGGCLLLVRGTQLDREKFGKLQRNGALERFFRIIYIHSSRYQEHEHRAAMTIQKLWRGGCVRVCLRVILNFLDEHWIVYNAIVEDYAAQAAKIAAGLLKLHIQAIEEWEQTERSEISCHEHDVHEGLMGQVRVSWRSVEAVHRKALQLKESGEFFFCEEVGCRLQLMVQAHTTEGFIAALQKLQAREMWSRFNVMYQEYARMLTIRNTAWDYIPITNQPVLKPTWPVREDVAKKSFAESIPILVEEEGDNPIGRERSPQTTSAVQITASGTFPSDGDAMQSTNLSCSPMAFDLSLTSPELPAHLEASASSLMSLPEGTITLKSLAASFRIATPHSVPSDSAGPIRQSTSRRQSRRQSRNKHTATK
eukprot:Sspe_Gene.48988::Locus_25967_Transcript_1_1_Confidence_1.000_Length_1637::g.48988::m.48988